MWSWIFWRDAAERAIRTAAWSAVGALGADGLGVLDAPWLGVGSVAAMAAVLSVLGSLAGSQIGDPTSASLVRTDVPPAG